MKIDGYDKGKIPVRPVHFVLGPWTTKSRQKNSNEKRTLFHAPIFIPKTIIETIGKMKNTSSFLVKCSISPDEKKQIVGNMSEMHAKITIRHRAETIF